MDDADRASDLEEARLIAATAKIAKEVASVNSSLACDSVVDACDGEIGIERKKAVPFATRCIRCQTEYDKLFKGTRRF
jgi:RNA polymerase-binding transcription factor DksA